MVNPLMDMHVEDFGATHTGLLVWRIPSADVGAVGALGLHTAF